MSLPSSLANESKSAHKQRTVSRERIVQSLINEDLFPSCAAKVDFVWFARLNRFMQWVDASWGTQWLIEKLKKARRRVGDCGDAFDQFDPSGSQTGVGEPCLRRPDGFVENLSGQIFFDFGVEVSANPASNSLRSVASAILSKAAQARVEGDLELAIDYIHEFHLACGPNADSCFELGNLLFEVGRFQSASERFRQAVELDRDCCEAWNQLGNAEIKLNRLQAAYAAFVRAIEIDSTMPEALFNAGVAAEQIGLTFEAIRHYQDLLAIDPWTLRASKARERLDHLRSNAMTTPDGPSTFQYGSNYEKSGNSVSLRLFG